MSLFEKQKSTDWKWTMKDDYPKEKNGLKVFSCFACGGGSQAMQTASILIAFEKELLATPTDLILAVGDVTSTMAGAYNYFDELGNEKGNDIPSIAEQPYEMNVNKYDDNGELNTKYYEEYELERNQIFNIFGRQVVTCVIEPSGKRFLPGFALV